MQKPTLHALSLPKLAYIFTLRFVLSLGFSFSSFFISFSLIFNFAVFAREVKEEILYLGNMRGKSPVDARERGVLD